MTLALGSWPKQRHGKVQAESATRESHLHSRECEGMNPQTPKWTPIYGSWNPYGVLNLQRGISRVKTHFIKYIFYITENILKLKMSLMGSYDPFQYLKHKLWPKEGRELKCQFDSRPLKVANLLKILCEGGAVHIFGKILTRDTTLHQTSPQSEVCTRSYGPLKF